MKILSCISVLCCCLYLLVSCSNHTDFISSFEDSSTNNLPPKGDAIVFSTYASNFDAEYKIINGILFGKGKNSLGLFGQNDSEVYEEWVAIVKDQTVVHVEAVNATVMFLTDEGCVYILGNTFGLFTEHDSIEKAKYATSPQFIMDSCKYASLGIDFILLQKKDNTMWFVGKSKNGQSTKISNIITSPIKVAENIRKIKAFNYNSAWIDDKSSLYICGDNSYGQIGNGKHGSGFPTLYQDIVTKPYLVIENCVEFNWLDNSYEQPHAEAKTSDGKVYAWGNDYGCIPQLKRTSD